MSYDDEIIRLYSELPSFANEENQRIHQDLQNEHKHVKKLKSEIEDLNKRIVEIRKQRTITDNSIESTKTEVNDIEAKISNENHQITIIKGEKGRIRHDIDQIHEKNRSIQWKTNEIHAKIHIAENRIQSFQQKSSENMDELAYCQNIIAENEELLIVLNNNQKEDSIVAKKLIEQIEKQYNLINVMKKRLDDEISNTKTLQTELDKFSSQYQQIYNENQNLLNLINTPIARLMNINKEIEQKKNDLQQKQEKYQELINQKLPLTNNLEESIKQNKEIENQLKELQNKINISSDLLNKEEILLDQAQEDVETLKNNVIKLEKDENFYRDQIQKIENDIQTEMDKKEYYKSRLDEVNDIYESKTDLTLYYNEIKNRMESELEITKQELEKREKLVIYYKNQSEKLSNEKQKILNQINEAKTVKKTQNSVSKTLMHKMMELDSEIIEQQEIMNKIQKTKQIIEEKIEKVKNIPKQQNQLEFLQKEIESLRADSHYSKEKLSQAKQNVYSADVELEKRKNLKEKLEKEKNQSENEKCSLDIEIDSYQKRNFDLLKDLKDKIVLVNLLRLKIQKYQNPIIKSEQTIENENKKYQKLIEAAKMRIKELDGKALEIQAELNKTENEKHKNQIKLNELQQKLENQKIKYDEEIQPLSRIDNKEMQQIDLIKEYTKEKDLLLKKQEELENKIKSALTESNALQRATAKLNNLNIIFKKDSTEEEKEEKVLRETVKRLNEGVKKKVQELNERNIMREKLKQKLQQTAMEEASMQKELMKIQAQRDKTIKDIEKLNTEIIEENKVIQLQIGKHRDDNKIDQRNQYPFSNFEIKIETELIKNTIESSLQQLKELAKNNAKFQNIINEFIQNNHIILRNIQVMKPHAPYSSIKNSPRKINTARNSRITVTKSQRGRPDSRSQGLLKIKNMSFDI